MVDRNVVFQRIGTSDIVIVRIFRPPDDSAGLVFLARYRFELHFYETILEIRVIFDAHGIGGFARLLQDVGFAGGSVISLDCPLRLSRASLGGGPAGRRIASFEIIEVDCLRLSHRHTHRGHDEEQDSRYHIH